MSVYPINTRRIAVRAADEPTVPRFNPPFSRGLLKKSPTVAPSGRVRTKAIQNSNVVEIRVK
jgi:hypothetical protein